MFLTPTWDHEGRGHGGRSCIHKSVREWKRCRNAWSSWSDRSPGADQPGIFCPPALIDRVNHCPQLPHLAYWEFAVTSSKHPTMPGPGPTVPFLKFDTSLLQKLDSQHKIQFLSSFSSLFFSESGFTCALPHYYVYDTVNPKTGEI